MATAKALEAGKHLVCLRQVCKGVREEPEVGLSRQRAFKFETQEIMGGLSVGEYCLKVTKLYSCKDKDLKKIIFRQSFAG